MDHRFVTGSSAEYKISVSNFSRSDADGVVTFLCKTGELDPLFSSCDILFPGFGFITRFAVPDDLRLDIGRDLFDDDFRRPCGVITLDKVNAQPDDRGDFFGCLDAFGKRHDVIVMGEFDDVFYKMLLLRRILDIREQRPVDLNVIRHVAEKIAYVGVSRSVIVNCGLKSETLVFFLHLCQGIIAYLGLFRKFDNEIL